MDTKIEEALDIIESLNDGGTLNSYQYLKLCEGLMFSHRTSDQSRELDRASIADDIQREHTMLVAEQFRRIDSGPLRRTPIPLRISSVPEIDPIVVKVHSTKGDCELIFYGTDNISTPQNVLVHRVIDGRHMYRYSNEGVFSRKLPASLCDKLGITVSQKNTIKLVAETKCQDTSALSMLKGYV